ncbi:hypothetical protein [Leifsonia sp. Root112D2]|jgi:hypothetical protein|uniref:hypothetical protein n=1 Tax=Leifsonia sp. Root112D2 TaxID=1736426 RepID=UPI0006F68EEF|nr:hypothetical protein [Leifsonia sp. Root112D2]KQV07839.1 hypothetical protein ASC63_11670 [Leifsonia sp. Root112D2]
MSVVTAVVAAAEAHAPLIAPIWVFGVAPIVLFTALGFVIWTYRDVANRHSHKAGPDAAGHAGSPGATTHGAGHPHPAESAH